LKSVKAFLDLIKFEHTIFALPFAYLGMLVAANGWPGWGKFLWITIAMAAARTLAMALNRILDRRLDALNPRTAQRPLVTGSISMRTAWIGTILSAACLVLAAAMLGPLPLKLLPLALVFLVGYSYTKRFTELSHFILGFTDGLAPVGAWVAVRGSLFTWQDLPAWLFLAVVTLWIGGFDLLYACQDVDHDRQMHLYAIPARRGVPFALRLSTICHVLMAGLLIFLGILLGYGWLYWLALLVVAALLVWEHRLVTPTDLSRIGVAFFNVNSLIAVALFIGVLFQYIYLRQ
jgi:4-hydroxybenzoate polyprenyltransferase